jgi:predicted TIM-barrel fold metal-dependent hydrolase
MDGIHVIDADGHILENDNEIAQYFEEPYNQFKRSGVFSLFPSLDGWPRGWVRGLDKVSHAPADVWLKFLDDSKIDAAVLYPTAGLSFGLIQDSDWACALARAYNNWFYDRFYRVDSRLKGVAMLPVHNTQAAVEELRRAVTEQKMVAGLLPAVTMLNKGYGHSDFHPLYAEAQKLNVPLAVHGAVSRGLGFDFLQSMSMIHTLEHPLAQMIQLASVVLDGVFDLFPKLRIGFLEAGAGWIPYMMDRMDEKFHIDRKRKHFPLSKLPSEYIKGGNVYVTCETDERILDTVVREMGEDYLMYPTDFPHERQAGEFAKDIPEFLERPDLSESAKRKILCENAKRFYAMP